jgi:hypothetical protein
MRLMRQIQFAFEYLLYCILVAGLYHLMLHRIFVGTRMLICRMYYEPILSHQSFVVVERLIVEPFCLVTLLAECLLLTLFHLSSGFLSICMVA